MTPSAEFTPRDFFELVKELNTHEAELKIRLAKAGVACPETGSRRRKRG